MKKLFVFLLCFLAYFLTGQNQLSQNADTNKIVSKIKKELQEKIKDGKADSSKIDELTKKMQELREILDSKEENDVLAKFVLKNLYIKIKGQTLEINKAEVLIENGLMAKARVTTKNNKVFETKKRDGTYLFRLNEFAKNIYFYELETSDTAFSFSDIIIYLDELDKTNYVPGDGLITLNASNTEKKLFIGTDLNSFLDFRVYTDLLSLLNKQGNGLVQSEVSSKITYNAFAIQKHFFLFNYIEPYFKFSKFDNQFKNQAITDTLAPYRIDRLKLNQYAYIDLGFKFNLLRATIFQHSFDYLNIGCDFKYSDILLEKSKAVRTLNTFGYYLETRGQFLKYKNFGLEYAVQAYFQKIQDSQISNYNLTDQYLITEFSLFYHPYSNPQNMIFIRFKNFQNGDATDFYSLLQFGYKSRLSFKK